MERSLGDETRLILYALQSQAELGPCEPRSRWGMSAEDRAKHETWANLGKMEPHEAMRLFVKLLDDERPGWWKRSASASAPVPGSGPGGGGASRREDAARHATSPIRAVARVHEPRPREGRARDAAVTDGWDSNLARGVWVTIPHGTHPTEIPVSAPPPRYRHASCVVGDEMFVVGGSDAKGRLCKGADLFHVLNTKTGAWRSVATKHLRPCAGARLVTRGGNAYLVGGNVERLADAETEPGASPSGRPRGVDESDGDGDGEFLDVSRIAFSFDASTGLETAAFVVLETAAEAGTRKPRRRRGHTATLVPGSDALVVFGGEDENRRFLNDARVLDMRALRWRTAYEGDVQNAWGLFGGLFGGAFAGGRDPRAPAPRAEHAAAAFWARDDAFETSDASDGEDESEPGPTKKNASTASPSAPSSAPSARATLLVLGGAGASGACFDDAHALDVATGRWTVLRLDAYTKAESQKRCPDEGGGVAVRGPGARAGHASCVFLGQYLCVVGGGNDTTDRGEHAEASVLDLRSMAWLGPPRAFAAPPGAGEGLSLCALETARGGGDDARLVAFGGYDGTRCRNETHAFRVPLAFLEADDEENHVEVDVQSAPARRARTGEPRRSLWARFLDPGPAEPAEPAEPADPAAPADPAGFASADEREKTRDADAGASSRVDALARDNLRLRRENARLAEALAEARRAAAAAEAEALAARESLSALAKDSSRKEAAERVSRANAGMMIENARDEKDEEDPESRRGWLFGL